MTKIRYTINLNNTVVANKTKIKVTEKTFVGQIGKEKEEEERNII